MVYSGGCAKKRAFGLKQPENMALIGLSAKSSLKMFVSLSCPLQMATTMTFKELYLSNKELQSVSSVLKKIIWLGSRRISITRE